MRTSSEPARASATICAAVDCGIGGIGVGHALDDDRRAAPHANTADVDPRASRDAMSVAASWGRCDRNQHRAVDGLIRGWTVRDAAPEARASRSRCACSGVRSIGRPSSTTLTALALPTRKRERQLAAERVLRLRPASSCEISTSPCLSRTSTQAWPANSSSRRPSARPSPVHRRSDGRRATGALRGVAPRWPHPSLRRRTGRVGEVRASDGIAGPGRTELRRISASLDARPGAFGPPRAGAAVAVDRGGTAGRRRDV